MLLPDMELFFTEDELDRHFSFYEDGAPATLGDFIDQYAPIEARELFGREKKVPPAQRIKPINELSKDECRRIASQMARDDENEGTAFATNGRSYTPKELAGEILRGSSVGENFTDSARRHALMEERAIRNGRIAPKPFGPLPEETWPPF